jgi:hypothetical protein
LRAWLDQRARELRDAAAIQRVQVVDPGGTISVQPDCWTLVIDFSYRDGADPIVRDLMRDLGMLDASPELIELDSA